MIYWLLSAKKCWNRFPIDMLSSYISRQNSCAQKIWQNCYCFLKCKLGDNFDNLNRFFGGQEYYNYFCKLLNLVSITKVNQGQSQLFEACLRGQVGLGQCRWNNLYGFSATLVERVRSQFLACWASINHQPSSSFFSNLFDGRWWDHETFIATQMFKKTDCLFFRC